SLRSFALLSLTLIFMKGYIDNIEKSTNENSNFRKVLYTGKNSQLVLMRLTPGEDIGEEVHDVDQFFRIESGKGIAILDGVEHTIEDDFAIVVPAGATHNIKNTSDSEDLKLYTIYSPPNHKDGTVHVTKSEAEANEEHF